MESECKGCGPGTELTPERHAWFEREYQEILKQNDYYPWEHFTTIDQVTRYNETGEYDRCKDCSKHS